MSIVLNSKIKAKIRDYHKYHGDSKIEIVKVIQDTEGYDAVLVRVVNSQGEKYSCIDLMDIQGDISEFDSIPTENESILVEQFTSGYETCNELID